MKKILSVIMAFVFCISFSVIAMAVGEGTGSRYKLIYDANGADGTVPEIKSYSRFVNIIVENPVNLHKDGKHFAYWSEDRHGDNPVRVYASDVIRLDKDITLYAIFKNGTGSIDYIEDMNDLFEESSNTQDESSLSDVSDTSDSDSSVDDETSENSGNRKPESSDTSSPDPEVSEGENSHREISYDEDSGISVSESSEFSDDDKIIVKKPVNPDNFIEWNTRKDGSGDGYQPGDKIDPDTVLVLYPIYDKSILPESISGSVSSENSNSSKKQSNAEESSEVKYKEHDSRVDDINKHLDSEYYYDDVSELHEIENKQSSQNIKITDTILPLSILLVFVLAIIITFVLVSDKKKPKS